MKKLFFIIFLSLFFCQLSSKEFHTAFLWAYGLWGHPEQAQYYQDCIIYDPIISAIFPETYDKYGRIPDFEGYSCKPRLFSKSSLGQENEVEQVKSTFEKITQKHAGTEIIGFGVSRGATTLFNFAALYNPPELAALILESPFDCVESIINYQLRRKKLHWIPGAKHLGHKLARMVICKNYHKDGVSARNLAARFPKDVPVLIICVTSDHLVPYSSSLALYNALKANGHKKCHLLALESGKHGHLFFGEQQDLYCNVVHAFYQRYGFGYHEESAQAGAHYLR